LRATGKRDFARLSIRGTTRQLLDSQQTESYRLSYLLVNDLWESGQAHKLLFVGSRIHAFWLLLFNYIQARS